MKSAARVALERSARLETSMAIRSGRLKRPKQCPLCGSRNNIQAHHVDYEKPLEVEWKCRRCHLDGHVEVRTKPARLVTSVATGTRYRHPDRLDGALAHCELLARRRLESE